MSPPRLTPGIDSRKDVVQIIYPNRRPSPPGKNRKRRRHYQCLYKFARQIAGVSENGVTDPLSDSTKRKLTGRRQRGKGAS